MARSVHGWVGLVGLLFALGGCAKLPPGQACEASGEGFNRVDPCAHTCVEWQVPCADGTEVIPGVCSGVECEQDADCGPGFACAATGSVTRSCLPDDLCDAGYATQDVTAQLGAPGLGDGLHPAPVLSAADAAR